MWRPLYDALFESGLIPDPNTVRRVTIDAQVGKPCMLTYETFADGRIVDAVGVMHFTDSAKQALVK